MRVYVVTWQSDYDGHGGLVGVAVSLDDAKAAAARHEWWEPTLDWWELPEQPREGARRWWSTRRIEGRAVRIWLSYAALEVDVVPATGDLLTPEERANVEQAREIGPKFDQYDAHPETGALLELMVELVDRLALRAEGAKS